MFTNGWTYWFEASTVEIELSAELDKTKNPFDCIFRTKNDLKATIPFIM